LTPGPEFGITLADASPNLDGFHVIFGCVLEGFEVLDAISKLPRYTYKTKTGYAGQNKGAIDGDVADKWFESQKLFYVELGKSIGDTRAVDQRGKLLRRVVIKNVGEF